MRPLPVLTVGMLLDGTPMQLTAELAGLFVAHQLWYLAEGAPITPTLAYELVDGTRQITRIMMEDAQAAVEYGEEWLAENPEHATRAVLIADGFITLDERKIDAVIFQCRCYVEPVGALAGAVPYRPKDDARGFAIYPLQFLELDEEVTDTRMLGDAFFAGADRHDHAAQLWDELFEESF